MPTDEQIDLKTRPFCGGTASIRDGGHGCKFVQCDMCNSTSDDGSAERAAANWNARAAAGVKPEGQTYEVLLMASHCHDNPGCTDERPCPICLGMSNVFSIAKADLGPYLRQLAPDWNGSPILEAFSSTPPASTTEGG